MPKPTEVNKAASPTRFFQKQLAGEEGPSLEVATRLCDAAAEFTLRQPWNVLADQNLVLLQDPQSSDICYCSVMGALGEVFSLHVYLGGESYRLFRKIETGKPISAGEFFASQHAVSVELVLPSTLTPPDRELLKAVNYPMRRGVHVPIFRTFRPGYRPWYVTQQEATLLTSCFQAVLTLCQSLSHNEGANYWAKKYEYPLLVPVGSDKDGGHYEIKIIKASEPRAAPLRVPDLDSATIRNVQEKNYPQDGALEADYCVSAAAVGGNNERKICTRFALVTDAVTGLVFPPALGGPEKSAGDLLVHSILMAIESGKRLPLEVHVNQSEFKLLLEPLAANLGFTIRVTKSLPSLRAARKALMEHLGEQAHSLPESIA